VVQLVLAGAPVGLVEQDPGCLRRGVAFVCDCPGILNHVECVGHGVDSHAAGLRRNHNIIGAAKGGHGDRVSLVDVGWRVKQDEVKLFLQAAGQGSEIPENFLLAPMRLNVDGRFPLLGHDPEFGQGNPPALRTPLFPFEQIVGKARLSPVVGGFKQMRKASFIRLGGRNRVNPDQGGGGTGLAVKIHHGHPGVFSGDAGGGEKIRQKNRNGRLAHAALIVIDRNYSHFSTTRGKSNGNNMRKRLSPKDLFGNGVFVNQGMI